MSNRQKIVFEQVRELYENSQRKEAHWMWENHVQTVAQNCLTLAARYHADADLAFSGGLLHDLGDVWYTRDDPRFEPESKGKAEEILKKAGISPDEIVSIIVKIIAPHSCMPGDEQTMIEGKILATADALAHLQTNFYYDFKKMGWPQGLQPEEFNEWVNAKIDRDFDKKIFFAEVREKVKPLYEKLKKDFPVK